MELYELWKPLMRDGTASFWQEFYVKFYQAFIEGSRWKQYLNGVGTTLLVTAMALTLGILLGIVVAVIRTAHDQQRTGHKNPILGAVQRHLQGIRHRHPRHAHDGAAADHGLRHLLPSPGTTPWWAR